jgi:hypothetical protein
MQSADDTKKIMEIGKLLAAVIGASMLVGVATAGYGDLPERVVSLEKSDTEQIKRIETVERGQSDLKRELKLISCLQLAQAQGTAYQECLNP